MHEIKGHERQHALKRRANAQGVDLARGDAVLADEILELPGDQPVEQADADRKGRVEERKEDITQTEQITAALIRVAFGSLRLNGSAPALEIQGLPFKRFDGVLHVLHHLL